MVMLFSSRESGLLKWYVRSGVLYTAATEVQNTMTKAQKAWGRRGSLFY